MHVPVEFPFLESGPTCDIRKTTVQVILCLLWARGFRSPGVSALVRLEVPKFSCKNSHYPSGETTWRGLMEREKPWNYKKENQGRQPTAARTKARWTILVAPFQPGPSHRTVLDQTSDMWVKKPPWAFQPQKTHLIVNPNLPRPNYRLSQSWESKDNFSCYVLGWCLTQP